jgi:hypothetical protein
LYCGEFTNSETTKEKDFKIFKENSINSFLIPVRLIASTL